MSITTAGDAIRYEEFRTADTAAMRRFFADAYPPSWRVGAVSDGAQLTHRRFATDSVTLNEVLIDGRLSCEIEAFDTVLAIHPLSGSMAVTAEPKRGLETVVIAADALPCAIDVEDARFRVVGLGMRELSRVASEGKSIPPQHVRFLDYKPRSAAAANSWTRALDYVVTSFGDVDSARQPLLVGAAAHLLSAALLDCFPNNAGTGQDLLSEPDLPPALKGAISFIHRHCADGIGVNDVADSLRMTPRAVQYLFRRHLATTPTEYLRRVRLHHAHQELRAGDRSTATVGEIAQRWGFSHTGRFAALYRRSYGQSPQATLHQQG